MNDAGIAETTQGHNADARRQIIREVCADLDEIDGKIKSLQLDRTNIKNKRIKGDLAMKMTDFNMVRRFYALESDDRDTLFDTLREGLEALGVGWPGDEG